MSIFYCNTGTPFLLLEDGSTHDTLTSIHKLHIPQKDLFESSLEKLNYSLVDGSDLKTETGKYQKRSMIEYEPLL